MSRIAILLKLIGFSSRSIIWTLIFVGAFIIGSVVLILGSGNSPAKWIIYLSPLILVFFILLLAIMNPSIRYELDPQSKEKGAFIQEEKPYKLHVAIACHATYGVLGILLICSLLLLDMSDIIFEAFSLYVVIGWVPIYLLMWPFFMKKLK